MRSLGLILSLTAVSWGLTPNSPIRVVITSPDAEVAAFGEVVFSVDVTAEEPIDKVDFFVDGTLAASDDRPPYRVTVDSGERNVEKRFTAVAHGLSNETGSASLVTPSVAVDFEVELSLQQLYVTATRNDEPALDLERDDFRVFEAGIEQELVTFGRGNIPMTVVLLLDASESMRGARLEAALRARNELLHKMGALDEVMMLVFSDRTLRVEPFVLGGTAPVASTRVEAMGGTALNDHLYAALRLLNTRLGRPVVVLLSDGADTLSFLSIDDVRWKMRRSDAVIFRIRLGTGGADQLAFATSWRGFHETRTEVSGLEDAILESGGRSHSVTTERLEETVAEVIQELRQQYVLGYYPRPQVSEGTWRPIRVEVDAPGVRVRTRSGYVAH